jgi:transposase-like protein
MGAMAKHRTHSAAFKRQVAEEFIAGEALHALSKRHDISRQLIRIWVGKFEAGALDDDVQAADLLQEYEAKIAALERMVGRQALEYTLPARQPEKPKWSRVRLGATCVRTLGVNSMPSTSPRGCGRPS